LIRIILPAILKAGIPIISMSYSRKHHQSIAYSVFASIVLLFLVFCTPKDNPYTEPENIQLSLAVHGDSAVIYHDISDSLNLSIILKLADLVERVVVDWNSPNEARDTVAVSASAFEDTIILSHYFTSQGDRTIHVTAIPANSSMQKSADIVIKIGRKPVISQNGRVLVPDVLNPDSACFLAVAATGSDTLAYAWYHNSLLLPGSINDSIYFDSVTAADTGSFFCIVSNKWGRDTSANYHLLDTISFNAPVRITVTSPFMQTDSSVVRTTLLAIGGTVVSTASIASLAVLIDTAHASVVGMQTWSFPVSELTPGRWNRIRIMARDNNGGGDTLTVYLFLMPTLPAPSVPKIIDRRCARIDLAWQKSSYCTRYHVYRYSPDSQTLDTVIETADTLLIDSSLASGQSYYYKCRGWYSVPGMNSVADSTAASALVSTETVHCYEKAIGGLNNDMGIGVVVMPDSGCLVAGTSYSTRPGNSDIYLVRLDQDGDTVWTKPYGQSQDYTAVSLRLGNSGEVIVGAGFTCLSCGMSNVSSIAAFSIVDGAPLFDTSLNRLENNSAYDAMRTNTGGFAFVSFGKAPLSIPVEQGTDALVYVYALRAAGDSLWKKFLVFQGYTCQATSVTQSADGSFYVTGLSVDGSPPIGGVTPEPKCFAARISATGDSLWSRIYGSSMTYTWGTCIRPTSDGGFIITGETGVTGLPHDAYLLKITNTGAPQWSKSYGTSAYDYGAQVIECFDGGFAIAGGSYGTARDSCDAYLVKTDDQGVKQWEAWFGGAKIDCAWSLAQTPDSGFVLAGDVRSFGNGGTDMYVIKTDKYGSKIK
jgi:hypothetical protein